MSKKNLSDALVVGCGRTTARYPADRKRALCGNAWKEAIVAAHSEDAVKIEVLNEIQPLPGTAGYGTVSRSLRTPFVEEWGTKLAEAGRERDRLLQYMQAKTKAGLRHEVFLTAGQICGGVKEILSVAEIVRRLTREAEAALSSAANLMSYQ